jgi:hypothetical protein
MGENLSKYNLNGINTLVIAGFVLALMFAGAGLVLAPRKQLFQSHWHLLLLQVLELQSVKLSTVTMNA